MLSINGLSHTYPNGVRALHGINLEIPRGMFGLLGPNGAGKSTLMRTIATLQQPSSGDIRLDDIDVLQQPEKLRRVLGYLPQEFGVYPRGSALQILDHIAVLKGIVDNGERREMVEALLQQTNLYEVRKKRLSTFSGGMHQRFGIAQALIGSPQLLIVDEPTAGLDPEERNRFYNLLSAIGEEVVVILSTHIVEDVAVLCQNMAVIARGEVVLQGRPDDLLSGYAGMMWEKQVSQAELSRYSETLDVVSSHFNAGRLMIRVKSGSVPDPAFESSAPTLEDLYFTAIRKQPSSLPATDTTG